MRLALASSLSPAAWDVASRELHDNKFRTFFYFSVTRLPRADSSKCYPLALTMMRNLVGDSGGVIISGSKHDLEAPGLWCQILGCVVHPFHNAGFNVALAVGLW